MLASEVAPRALPSERVCDGVCLYFALWTLCCHAVVAAGGTLVALIVLYAVALAVVLALRFRFGAGGAEPAWVLPAEPRPSRPRPAVWRWILPVAGVAIGLGIASSFARSGDVVRLWWQSVALLGVAAAAILLRDKPRASPPRSGPRLEGLLWLLAFACATVTLVSHRPDGDDAFYVNLAVAAADRPHWALLSTDTLHGIPGLSLQLPIYRVHSYELWNGALSYLSGIPAIYCFHWLSAAVAALLVPFAYARLLRLLTPRQWLWGVAAVILVLVAAGETHRWYGNFAFVRMWQGKSILLSVFLPLIYAYGLRFALRPTRRGWLLLAAAQIAAVGCSSTAIWVAPMSAFLALVCGLRPSWRSLRIFAAGALASAYVLLTGWLMKSGAEEVFGLASPDRGGPGDELGQALEIVLGDGRLQLFALAAVLVAWAVCARGLARRFALILPLAVLLFVLNPYFDRWLTVNLTGPSYWRTLWALPIPLLMAWVLTSPLRLDRARWRWAARVACLLLLATYTVWIPRYGGLSSENRVRLGRPELKVPQPAYRWAAALNRAVPPGSYVVAPPMISAWVATFHHHAYALRVRRYLRSKMFDDPDNLRRRRDMIAYVAGTGSKDFSKQFRRGLELYDVSGVCLRTLDQADEARTILRAAGFRRNAKGPRYEIWVRSPSVETPNIDGATAISYHYYDVASETRRPSR